MHIDKNTSVYDKVENQLIKAVNWEDELRPFLEINDVDSNFTISTDSNQLIKITTYTAAKPANPVQQISINYFNNKPQVVAITTSKNSYLVQRTTIYSYMPQKGYSIAIEEKYPWTKNKKINIDATFIKQDEIR